MAVAGIEELPGEILERIFRLLPPRVLKVVVLVSRRWRKVGEAPLFWSWVLLPTVDSGNLAVIPKMLETRRLENVREMTMFDVSEELLQAVGQHKGLKVLNMLTDLSWLTPGLLAKMMAGKEELTLNVTTALTGHQLEEVLTAISENSSVKKLDLSGGHNMTSIAPDLLARAVSQLENVDIGGANLTNRQTEAIFDALNESTKLKVLNMEDMNLSSVDASLMARVVNSLEEATLHYSQLSTQQAEAILAQSCVQTNLKKLIFDNKSFERSLNFNLVKQANRAIETLFIEGVFEWSEDEDDPVPGPAWLQW